MRLKWEGGRDYATEEGRRSFHYSKHEFIALIFPPSDSPTLIPLAISKCVANAAARQSFSEAPRVLGKQHLEIEILIISAANDCVGRGREKHESVWLSLAMLIRETVDDIFINKRDKSTMRRLARALLRSLAFDNAKCTGEGHWMRISLYRDEIYSLQIFLSRTQAGPGRTVKKEQEEISPNLVQRLNLISVYKVCL